ncbi:aminotransferase class V-fold PLP-dependent enzyme [uncultured Microscilla sp.]|uniref:aminotransferase class V-fold PLP-dependent enzyme n=1 Tax=uncultured Microscilla sp. TaxID=432653 RepID=UPI00262FE244|nr:aminotransferase class V-fold PLP-dependent enzyme [uncultured Microscilla sp.]
MKNLTCQKHLFSLPNEISYFNNAYMAPSLKVVSAAGIAGVEQKNRPYEVLPRHFFEDTDTLRAEYARLINVTDPQRIVVTPSVSYGIANAARNIDFEPGDEILLIDEQFPSNVYVWQRLAKEQELSIRVVAPPEASEQRGKTWNERILAAISPQTKVVAMAHVHWADGTLFDLEAIRRRTRETKSLLIIDGTQSVGALPFNVATIQPDALVCAGYKWLMGGYSLGLAYYGKYFDQGTPIEENWMNRHESENFAGLVNYQEKYQEGALRYEVGEHSNFILIPMLKAAIAQINEWGVANIQAYAKKLTQDLVVKLRAHGCWIEDENHRAAHIIGVHLPSGVDVTQVKDLLTSQKVYVSVRGNSIRISSHVYNNEEDIQKLLTCFEQVLSSKVATSNE